MDANQAKADADRKAWREEMAAMRKEMDANQAKAETRHKDFLARMDARWNAWREIMNASHDKTVAYQEVEARPQEKEPTSVDTKPEAAEERQVPEENTTVMPVKEPKKKRPRDRRLAVERHHHKQKILTRENGAPQKKLAVACRKVSRRAKVARHKENTVRRNHIGNNVARRTLKGRGLQVEPDGSIGVKDKETRRRLHPGNERTASRTLSKTLGLDIRQRAVEVPSRLENIKNCTLWRGRPPPKRKKGNGLYGRNRW
jgi:hypothetical protein